MKFVLFCGSFDPCIVVPDISAAPVPSPLAGLVAFDREDGYFHTLPVQAVSFDHVHNVQSDLAPLFVPHSEEEPVVIAVGVGIVFQ